MAPTLKSVLNDVYSDTISMDDKTTKQAKQIVKSFVIDTFIEEMKEADVLFKSLYEEVFFAGSFYDGLRVGEATEFDLNIVIDLPFYSGDFDLVEATSTDATFFKVVPGSAVYCTDKQFHQLIPKTHPRYSDYNSLNKFFEAQWYSGLIMRQYKYVMLPSKLRFWFQSIVKKTENQLISKYTSWFSRKVYGKQFNYGEKGIDIEISVKEDGPAFTLNIKSKSGLEIDVDLVPVFKYRNVFLVPKPRNGESEESKLWRLSYAKQERIIFHDQSCAKKVVKLLKRFRDMQGAPWKKLSSYYLKTLVMLELGAGPSWLDGQIDRVFVDCLKKLLMCLNERKIPFQFDHSCNLLETVKNETIDNMKGRLHRIVKDIDTNPPETLRKYFVKEECSTDTIDGSEPSSCVLM